MLFKHLLTLVLLAMLTALHSVSADRESSVFESNNDLDHLEEQYDIDVGSVPHTEVVNSEESEFVEEDLPMDDYGDISFMPARLFYKDSPLSLTASQEFEILNSLSTPVIVYAVRSNNRQFHSLLANHQEIQPGKRLAVQIIYLPYHVEAVSAELTIVTSRGEYRYPISGNSVLNPYHINPQLGVRFPAGVSILEKPIVVFNPHKETLYITEVFTSEPFLSLKGAAFQRDKHGAIQPPTEHDIPTGKLWDTLAESIKKPPQTPEEIELLWTIPPGTEKEIITLSVSTELKPGRHEGFLHIKTNFDNIVMPLELQIITALVYPQQEELFFGTLSSTLDRKTHELWMNNNGVSHVTVTEIIPVDPDPNLEIELVPYPIIFAGDKISSRVAKLTYSGLKTGAVNNRLLIITNNSNAASAVVDVRYSANVMHGGLRFEQAQTLFFVDIYNQTYPEQCLHCDRHGHTHLFDPLITEPLLKEYHSSEHMQDDQEGDNGDSLADADSAVSRALLSKRPEHMLLRQLTLTNFFDAPVVLNDVHFSSCQDLFSTSFQRAEMSEILDPHRSAGVVVHKLQPWKPVALHLNKALVYALYRENSDFLPKTCHLDVTTNVSSHRISMHLLTAALSIDHMDMPMIEDFGLHGVTSAGTEGRAYGEAGESADQEEEDDDGEDYHGSSTTSSKLSEHSAVGTSVGSIASGTAEETEGEPMRCEDEVCYSPNSDIYHIEMGNQSVAEPRSLHIVVANTNPVQVPMRVSYSSHDVCVCTETSWTMTPRDAEVVESMIHKSRSRSWTDSRNDADKCFCLAPTLEGAEVSTGVVAGAKSSSGLKDAEPANPLGVKLSAYVTDVNQKSVFSIALRELSLCRIYPEVLYGQGVVNGSECRSYPVDDTTDAGEHKFQKLNNGDRSSVRVDLLSSHQRLQLHLHFTARTGRLRTRIAPPGVDRSMGGQYLLGQGLPMTLRTRSYFTEPLKDVRLTVVPNTVFKLQYDPNLVNAPSTKTWYTGVHMSNICGERTFPTMHQEATKLESVTPDDHMSLWRCAYNLLTGLNFSDPYNANLLNALRRQDAFVQKMATTSPKAAFDAGLRLKQTWLNSFMQGIPLPTSSVHVDTAQTSHVYRIENATLQSPQMYFPHSYTVHLPTVRVGQVQWFYLHVYNPYELPVMFSLLEETTSETTKRMKALGGLFFQPTGLEVNMLPKVVQASSRYQCMGSIMGSNVRTSRSPMPCECRNSNIKRLNESYCEIGLTGPVEGGINVDEGVVFRSRSLSIVHSAVSYSSASAALSSLNKLFTTDVAGSTEGPQGAISSADGTSAAAPVAPRPHSSFELPFLPQSSVDTKWIVMPRSTARIGPFLYAPRTKTSTFAGTADAKPKSSFYIYNNFTGYDMVDIYTSAGAAKLEQMEVSTCLTNSSTVLRAASLPICNNTNIFAVHSAGLVTPLPSSPPGVQVFEVQELGQRFLLSVNNTGDVSTTVHDMIFDGFSCRKQKHLSTLDVTNGGWTSYAKALTRRILSPDRSPVREIKPECMTLPVELPPKGEVLAWAVGPVSCSLTSWRRTITFSLDESVIGDVPGKLSADFSSTLMVDLLFQMSPELQQQCLAQPRSSASTLVLLALAGAVALFTAWQMLSLSLLVKQQRRKYVAAKQQKGNRRNRSTPRITPRSPSLQAPGGSVDVEGAHPHPVPLRTVRRENSASSTSSGVAAHGKNPIYDLSDVLTEVEPPEQSAEVPVRPHDEPDWIEVRPRLRAVDALQSKRVSSGFKSPAIVPPPIVVPASKAKILKLDTSAGAGDGDGDDMAAADENLLISPSTVAAKGIKSRFSEEGAAPPGLASLLDAPDFPAEEPSVASSSEASSDKFHGDSSAVSYDESQADSNPDLAGLLTASSSDLFEPATTGSDTMVGGGSAVPTPSPAASPVEVPSNTLVDTAVDLAEQDGLDDITAARISANTPQVSPAKPTATVIAASPADKKSKSKAAAKNKDKDKSKESMRDAVQVLPHSPADTELLPASHAHLMTPVETTNIARPMASAPAPLTKKKSGKESAKEPSALDAQTPATAQTKETPVVPEIVVPAPASTAPGKRKKDKAKSTAKATNLVAASLTRFSPEHTASQDADATAIGVAEAAISSPSPLRLKHVQVSAVYSTSASEDSPLFRYSGQLLDPTRDSSAALDVLSEFPTPSDATFPPFPTVLPTNPAAKPGGRFTDSAFGASLDDDLFTATHAASLLPELPDEFTEMWGTVPSAASAEGLGLDLELNLDLGYSSISASISASQDILGSAVGSELRVSADPFYSSINYDSLHGSRHDRLRSDNANARPQESNSTRDRSASASNYLHDLLASAAGAPASLRLDQLGAPARALDSNDRGEWWPNGKNVAGRHLPPDAGYFDGGDLLGHPAERPGRWAAEQQGPGHMGQRGPGLHKVPPPAGAKYVAPRGASQMQPQQPPLRNAPHEWAGSVDSYYREQPRAGNMRPPPGIPPGIYADASRDEPFFNRGHQPRVAPQDPRDLVSRYRQSDVAPYDPRMHHQHQQQLPVQGRYSADRGPGAGPGVGRPHDSAPPAGALGGRLAYDYLDLDRTLEEEANSWIGELTDPQSQSYPGIEHQQFPHRGGGQPVPQARPRMAAPVTSAQPQPQDSRPNNRPVPSPGIYRAPRPNQPQELHRSQRLPDGSAPPPSAYNPHPEQSRYGASPEELLFSTSAVSSGGYFARPEVPPAPLHTRSPGRDAEAARWMALNAHNPRSVLQQQQLQQQQQQQRSPVPHAAGPAFASAETAAVAAELNFFAPQGFFGSVGAGADMPLEALEDDN